MKKPFSAATLSAASLAAALFTVGFSAGPVSAADCTFSTPAVAGPSCSVEVKPITLDPSPSIAGPDTTDVPTKANLPVTGVETATLAAAGVLMIAGGAVLVGRTRRPAEAT